MEMRVYKSVSNSNKITRKMESTYILALLSLGDMKIQQTISPNIKTKLRMILNSQVKFIFIENFLRILKK